MRPQLALSLVLLSVPLAGCTDILNGPPNGVGFNAKDYLRNTGPLVIELDHVQGAGPNDQALAVLVSTLESVTGRSVTVDRQAQLPAKGANYAYSFRELIDMADTYRDTAAGQGSDVMHFMYLDGRISADGSDNILGLAFNGVNVAIAKGKIREISCAPDQEVLGRCIDGRPRQVNIERAVLVHEGGHLLGLVNEGIEMVRDHEDPESPGHSKFDDSVMWWGVETSRGIQNLLDGGNSIPFEFDEFDREDLRNAKQSGGEGQ